MADEPDASDDRLLKIFDNDFQSSSSEETLDKLTNPTALSPKLTDKGVHVNHGNGDAHMDDDDVDGFDLFCFGFDDDDAKAINSPVLPTLVPDTVNTSETADDSTYDIEDLLKLNLFGDSTDSSSDDEDCEVTLNNNSSEMSEKKAWKAKVDSRAKVSGSGSKLDNQSARKQYETRSKSKTKVGGETNTPSYSLRSGAIKTGDVKDTKQTRASATHNRHMDTGAVASKPTVVPDERAEDFCCICLDDFSNPKTLHKCSHQFCTDCIDQHFKIKPVCPVCFIAYGTITGNQPKGDMTHSVHKKIHLPGYEKYDTIMVCYSFPDGTQTADHPNPGETYYGTSRTGYLPNSPEGQKVLKLLKASFERRLTFTVGRSRTTGQDNVVTWNDVHHKTCTHGGPNNFGYPDPTYLERVQQELAGLGVTEESLTQNPR